MGEPLYNVRVVKNIMIPLKDGVHQAADLFLPETNNEVPAIISRDPYHKDGLFGNGRESSLYFLARRGYACAQVDIRGSGNSEGHTSYPWGPQELSDGYETVEWIAEQPWCNGKVGMTGLSYGGYTSIQAAAMQPPHLKAIVPMEFGVDLYSDWFFPGGSMNMYGSMSAWSPMMFCLNLAPPAYQDSEGRWLKVWKEHLEENTPWILSVFEHRTDDIRYREGSVCYTYDRINVPTMIVGAWRDIYPDAVLQLYMNIHPPKKLLMGPWLHGSPSVAPPGPNVDVMRESVRWFDRWLKDVDTGVTDEPPITLYVQGADEWRSENEWPLERTEDLWLYLSGEHLLSPNLYDGAEVQDSFEHDAAVGLAAGIFGDPQGLGIGLPSDQRVDQALSLNYFTPPLPKGVEVTGHPSLILFAESSSDEAALVAKLCDVHPDGSVSLVTTGWLNLAHRESHVVPMSPIPGEVYELTIELCPTSYLFRSGHRIALNIASSDFPRVWPTSKRATNTIWHSAQRPSRLMLPTVPEQSPLLPRPLLYPPPAAGMPSSVLKKEVSWNIVSDPLLSRERVVVVRDQKLRPSEDTVIHMTAECSAETSRKDPGYALAKNKTRYVTETSLGIIEVRTSTSVSNSQAILTADILKDGLPYYHKSWDTSIGSSKSGG